MSSRVTLNEVDGVEIVSLVDNTVDFLSTTERKEVHQVREWIKNRMSEEWVKKHFRLPVAEHGFSMLIKVFSKEGFTTYCLTWASVEMELRLTREEWD